MDQLPSIRILCSSVEVLLYVHRNRRLITIRDGSPGRPPRLSHSYDSCHRQRDRETVLRSSAFPCLHLHFRTRYCLGSILMSVQLQQSSHFGFRLPIIVMSSTRLKFTILLFSYVLFQLADKYNFVYHCDRTFQITCRLIINIVFV